MAAYTDIAALDALMATQSYISGCTPSQTDVSVFKAIAAPAPTFKNAARWYKHISSFSEAKLAALPGTFQKLAAAAGGSAAAPAPAEKKGKPTPEEIEAMKAAKAAQPKKEKAPKEEKKKEAPAKAAEPASDADKEAAEAKKAAAAAEKLRQKIIKEGGKKGVEIEGASEMGGLDFFCTTVELPEGDIELLELAMIAMNAEPDPEAEDRKGCSGLVGKMIFSAGVEQLAMVAYVPTKEFNKSADKVDVTAWMDDVCKNVSGKVVKKATPVVSLVPNKRTGAIETDRKIVATEGKIKGTIVTAVVKSDPEKGKFALKDKDAAMAAAFAFLRSKDAFPADDGDDSDDMIFGDDDNFDDFE